MKKLFPFLLLIITVSASAQVQVDKRIELTGSGNDARVTGIDSVSAASDAVSVVVHQSGRLVYAAAAGTGGNYSVTLDPAITGLQAGMIVHFKANHANTGPATLDVNGLGAVPLKKQVLTDLVANDIIPNLMVSAIYDGTNFQFLGQTAVAPGTGGSGPSKRIFMSSSTHTSDFGGLAAGDSICQGLADAQGLGGTWNALLSTSVVDAKDRFAGSFEYRNMVGSLISSNSFQDAWDNPAPMSIFRKVDYMENGLKTPNSNPRVWTGTNSSGTIWNGNCPQKGGSCNDWTYVGAQPECCCTPCNTGTYCGIYGVGDTYSTTWVNGGQEGCYLSNHLYCFER